MPVDSIFIQAIERGDEAECGEEAWRPGRAVESGLDIAAALTPEIDDRAAAVAAAKAGIELRPLSDHSRRRGRLNGFVVGFAAVDACSIRDGARQLSRILEGKIRTAGSRTERT